MVHVLALYFNTEYKVTFSDVEIAFPWGPKKHRFSDIVHLNCSRQMNPMFKMDFKL